MAGSDSGLTKAALDLWTLALSPGCWLAALIFENFDAGDKKSEKQTLSSGT